MAIAVVAAVVMFGRGSGSDVPPPKPVPTEQVKPPAPEAKAPETKTPETKTPETKAPEATPPETPSAQPEQPATAQNTPPTTPETPTPTEQPPVAQTGTSPVEDDGKDDEPEQPAAQKLSPEAEYADLVRRSKRLIAAGKFKTAALAYRKALSLKPDSAEAKAGLGIALVSSDPSNAGYREAVKLLEDGLKDQPNNARAWLCLGMARQMTQQDKKAVDAYKRYLLLEPAGQFANDVRAALKQLGQ